MSYSTDSSTNAGDSDDETPKKTDSEPEISIDCAGSNNPQDDKTDDEIESSPQFMARYERKRTNDETESSTSAYLDETDYGAISEICNDLSVLEAEILGRISSFNIIIKESNYDLIADRLRINQYNAFICTTEWNAIREQGKRYKATYTFIDILHIREIGGIQERLIVDVDFQTQFTYYMANRGYQTVIGFLPKIFVGSEERLRRIISITSSCAGGSAPHWTERDFLLSKWLSPNRTRRIFLH